MITDTKTLHVEIKITVQSLNIVSQNKLSTDVLTIFAHLTVFA